MPRVGAEVELRTLTECLYSHPAQTLSDLNTVRSLFPDLRLYVDFYCFPNKERKKLVYLGGTVPVQYEGSEYNIPVCMWLHETHPVSRPRCYVCPSVSMVINPSCPCVDASGNVSLDGLRNWTAGVSSLSLLVSEMTQAFQRDTPLYARCPAAGVKDTPPHGRCPAPGSVPSSSSSSSPSHRFPPSSTHQPGQKASDRGEVKVGGSYAEELLGIDFSAPPPSSSSSSSSSSSNNPFLRSSSSSSGPPSDPLSRRMAALVLDGQTPVGTTQSESGPGLQQAPHPSGPGLQQAPHPSGPGLQQVPHPKSALAAEHIKAAARLPPHQASVFLSLMAMEGRSFSPDDVMEAVHLNRDFPSALRFLTHSCPICQDQVSFSKIITMTHCSCFLCQACFKAFFSAAIKERSVDQLVCPQCGQPEVRGQGGLEESMDYFNLLDTQIRHFLPPQIHELFQRKLRDRALQEMPNFCWCAHCSFGMLHEADRLRMDCPSCKKSTCSQCRSAWSPQHQGLSCDQFRVWQQQNQPELHRTSLLYNSIECPRCQLVFSLSKGGCLHFTCSQCQHQFCGGCSQTFTLGPTCSFSVDCGSKGLHAHHPRDCLYHLRDWSVSRLHLLLQHYRVSASLMEPSKDQTSETGLTASCSVLELRDETRREEPCGRPALPEYRGHCQLHYKERLVELINRCRADPAVLFSLDEMKAELQRWSVAMPTRNPDEGEAVYLRRLRLTLINRVPLRKQRLAPPLGPPLAPPPPNTSVPRNPHAHNGASPAHF